ncbi:MAG TPA: efflux RND transporter permease subunit, partial [Kofleriaceae bacterium]
RDIGNVVVAETKGVPVRVQDIARVLVGYAPRLGIVGKDLDSDIVQGVVLMRYGGDSLKTIEGVHERVEYIRKYRLLPPGMDIEPYYDRAALVKLTTHTVIENLIVGMLLVTVMLWMFLGHTRAALITAVNIPLALMIAFIGMVTTGTPANLISLGAVDFGIVVDSTVIMVENIFRHLGPDGKGSMSDRIMAAAKEVAPSMLFSTLIIGTAFIPLFTLTGVAGVIFSPMAHTYAFAIGGAMLLAVTLTPVLASRGLALMTDGHEEHNWLMRGLNRFYLPLFNFAIKNKGTAIVAAVAPVVVIFALSSAMGREFMPKLEEGNFWIRATLPTSVSLDQSAKYVGRMRAILLGCPGATTDAEIDPTKCDEGHRTHPEITTVVSQLGRPDDGTDVSGFYNIELFAPLKPNNEWRSGVTKEKMTAELSKQFAAAFPGVIFNFSQAISDNVEEAMSGVKGENTVKVIGPDLRVNEAKGAEIEDILATVKGIEDLGMFHSLGQPNVRITPDRIPCGRYGLNVGDVEQVVQAAIGGQAITDVFEGEKKFSLTVRWAPQFRKDLQTIRNILVAAPDGTQVPLGQLAQIVEEEGPSLVYREDLRRYTPVKFSVRGRDLASTIAEAEQKSLPARHAAPRPPQARRVTTCRAPFMKRVRVAP